MRIAIFRLPTLAAIIVSMLSGCSSAAPEQETATARVQQAWAGGQCSEAPDDPQCDSWKCSLQAVHHNQMQLSMTHYETQMVKDDLEDRIIPTLTKAVEELTAMKTKMEKDTSGKSWKLMWLGGAAATMIDVYSFSSGASKAAAECSRDVGLLCHFKGMYLETGKQAAYNGYAKYTDQLLVDVTKHTFEMAGRGMLTNAAVNCDDGDLGNDGIGDWIPFTKGMSMLWGAGTCKAQIDMLPVVQEGITDGQAVLANANAVLADTKAKLATLDAQQKELATQGTILSDAIHAFCDRPKPMPMMPMP